MQDSAILPIDRLQRPLPAAPSRFDGTIASFVHERMEPMLPSVRAVGAFHAGLVAYLERPDATFVVRHVSGLTRRERHRTDAGEVLLPGDNSPPWWVHSLLWHDAWPPADLGAVLEALPKHVHDAQGIQHANSAGWHLAHLLGVKDGDTDWRRWPRRDLTRRMVRNLHPCNHFFVPKAEWQRVGAHGDLHEYVAWVYRKRYRSVWSEFLSLAGGTAPRPRSQAGDLTLTISNATQTPPKSSGRTGRRVVVAMHFVCRGDRNVNDLGDGTFETGVWKVSLQHAETVETVALHDNKNAPSYRHGRVLGWRTVEHEGSQRVVFTVQQTGRPQRWCGGGSGEKGYRWSEPSTKA